MKFQIRGAEGFNRVYVPFITPWVVDIKKHPPPLLFPVSSFVLSERCTEKPVSSMAESGTIADIQVSVRQITQQSLVSRWYEMRARSSQSLLSSDWTLASKMVGRGGRKARHLRTRTPAFPSFPASSACRFRNPHNGFRCRVCEQSIGIKKLKVRFALLDGGTNVQKRVSIVDSYTKTSNT